jgi:cupin 2 domain-containing protein
VLLQGSAALEFAGQPAPVELAAGDYLLIPAHARHRVAWTDAHQPTIWLALHYD